MGQHKRLGEGSHWVRALDPGVVRMILEEVCTVGLDVIRKEAWPFYRTISGVRLCWELEEPKGPKRWPRLCQ